jgi:hypothetical protein
MPSKPSTALPKNWPPSLPYLIVQAHSPALTAAQQQTLRTKPSNAIEIPQNTPRGPYTNVKITPISNPSHPANGQAGLFAVKDLKPGTLILLYLGQIHASSSDPHDVHAKSDYDLSLDRDTGLGIDADRMGNEARFVNDYRGVGDAPNAEFKEVWDLRRGERGMAVFVLPAGKNAKARGIRKGEEILVSYGRGFWGARKEGD